MKCLFVSLNLCYSLAHSSLPFPTVAPFCAGSAMECVEFRFTFQIFTQGCVSEGVAVARDEGFKKVFK